jgi:protein rfbU
MEKITLNMSMIGEKNTGLGVYALNCRRELKNIFECKEILSNLNLPNIDMKNTIISPKNITLGYSKWASLNRLIYSKKIALRSDLGFVYTPTQHGLIGYKNQVITIHDLICIHKPEQHKIQYWYFKYILPHIIKDCKAIFTVSNTAKRDICSYYHVSEDFVYVIPNALEDNSIIEDTRDEGYLLVVGAAYEHKNIHELINNDKYWKDRYKLKIVSAKGSYGDYLKSLVKQRKLEDIVEIKGFVSDKELDELYRNCSALVYPSLWEGFGIPPLEAMRYQKPVILSNIDVFKEIFEDVAIYINIGDNLSWKNAFNILSDNLLIRNLLDREKDILIKYSWKSNRKFLKNLLISIMQEV